MWISLGRIITRSECCCGAVSRGVGNSSSYAGYNTANRGEMVSYPDDLDRFYVEETHIYLFEIIHLDH